MSEAEVTRKTIVGEQRSAPANCPERAWPISCLTNDRENGRPGNDQQYRGTAATKASQSSMDKGGFLVMADVRLLFHALPVPQFGDHAPVIAEGVPRPHL